mgnify:CR=1 FL=1
MEHTKGKVIVAKSGDDIYVDYINDNELRPRIAQLYVGRGWIEAEANAILITDAFNTANDSGLTPSQLYKQNHELLKALTAFIDGKERNFEILAKNTRQAINNAKQK